MSVLHSPPLLCYLAEPPHLPGGLADRRLDHCCEPNAYKRFTGDTIELVSLRTIEAGEEITHEYLINTDGGQRWDRCCGAPRCRGRLEASFFDLQEAIQREYLPLLAE